MTHFSCTDPEAAADGQRSWRVGVWGLKNPEFYAKLIRFDGAPAEMAQIIGDNCREAER